VTDYLLLSSRLVHELVWTQPGLDLPTSGGGQRNPKSTARINQASQFWVQVGVGRFGQSLEFAKLCQELQNVARKCKALSKIANSLLESTNFAKNC